MFHYSRSRNKVFYAPEKACGLTFTKETGSGLAYFWANLAETLA